MQNKLYTIIANIYNELKSFKGERETLGEAIEETVLDTVVRSEEMQGARGVHHSIGERLSMMEQVVNAKSIDTNAVLETIEKTKFEILEQTPDKVTEVVRDDQRDLLVSLENRMRRREDIIPIQPKDFKILPGEGWDYTTKAYVKTEETETPIREIDYSDPKAAIYDEDKESIINGALRANALSGLYNLPMRTAGLLEGDDRDMVYVPQYLVAEANYRTTSEKGSGQPYQNHLLNIFREGREWRVDRAYLAIVFTFHAAIPVKEIAMKLSTTAASVQWTLSHSDDGITYTSMFNGVGDVFAAYTNARKTKYLKLEVRAASTTVPSVLLSGLRISTIHYESRSSVVVTREPLIFGELGSDIAIRPKVGDEASWSMDTRYAISNQEYGEGKDEWYTYIPENLSIAAEDFHQRKGLGAVDGVLRNRYRFDKNAKTFLQFRKEMGGSSSVVGKIGTVSIQGYNSTSVSNSWLPGKQIAMSIRVVVKGATYTVPLSSSLLSTPREVTVGGITLLVSAKFHNGEVLRVSIDPVGQAEVAADSITVEFRAPKYMYDGSYYEDDTSSGSITATTASADGRLYESYRYRSTYRLYYRTSYNTYNYGGNGSEDSHFAIFSKDDSQTNTTMNTSSSSYTGSNATRHFVHSFTKEGCNLPATIFLGGPSALGFQEVIRSMVESVYTVTEQPVFTGSNTYDSTTFIGDSKVVAITPHQIVADSDDIQYAISFDGNSYYYYDEEKAEWLTFFGKGMTWESLTKITETELAKIRHGGEWLHLKALLNGQGCELSRVDISFEKDQFVPITLDELPTKGMRSEALQLMNQHTLRDEVLKNGPFLFFAQLSRTETPMERYAFFGYDLLNSRTARWQEIDNVTVKEYMLQNGSLLYENLGSKAVIIRVVRNILENRTGVVDFTENTKQRVNDLVSQQEQAFSDMSLLQQNLALLHETFRDTGSVPVDLPAVILPDTKEFDSDWVEANDTFAVEDVVSLRGIQVWEERSNYTPYAERLLFNESTKDRFLGYQVDTDNDGAHLTTDYDKDNPYLVTESYTSRSSTEYYNSMYDATTTRPPQYNSFYHILNDRGGDGYGYYHSEYWATFAGDTVYWSLPGEDIRSVDILLDFRMNVYIDRLSALQFGYTGTGASYASKTSISNQITSFAWSSDGHEYETVMSYTGGRTGETVNFKKELRYIRIRLELPYNSSKGAGQVTFKNMDIYHCPVRFVHNTEGYVQNKEAIDTSNWKEISQITVDRFIDHNPAEMKFVLSDSPYAENWKYWDGSTWVASVSPSLARSMSIQTLLSLTKTQLNLLERGSLYIRAIMRTTDTFKTPILRGIEILHTESESNRHYEIIDPYTMGLRYYEDDKRLILQNKSETKKRFKVILL